MYFDLDFNYIGGRIQQAGIVTNSVLNWESETCKLIPHVWYEYTRVSRKNPETSRSGKVRIKHAREKIKFFASLAKTNDSVLRIVKDTVVTTFLPSNTKALSEVEVYALEESYGSLCSDDAVSSQMTGKEMPPDMKEKARADPNNATFHQRRTKKRQ
jgi:hypothetical protein